MNKLHILFGVHNHQPVGNFDYVLEKAYAEAYKPFLDRLSAYPNIKFMMHCSGILWDYFKIHHNEYICSVKKMVENGQIELMSGGYYEPIIPVIPDKDKIGQISKMQKYLKNEFGVTPKGLWLTERIWEPHLPKLLKETGIEYTAVDDYHFTAAGFPQETIKGYYLTEDQGYGINIFPISQKLRYFIPFRMPEDVIAYFKELACAGDGENVGIIIDDGEKFGLWPETFKHVYTNGWLDKFLKLVDSNSDWISFTTCSEYMKIFNPSGRVYLPDTSYFEMSEWALPTKTQLEFIDALKYAETLPQKNNLLKFLRGGIWRNFLVKYPEANNLHKKMILVSNKVNKAKFGTTNDNLKSKAFDSLYAGQCNCAYWHGVFGGLYLPHLRHALYQKLIESENVLDNISKKDTLRFNEADFDCDSRNELLIEDNTQNIYISPHEGGAIFEWDIKKPRVNLTDVLTRRYEAYHEKLKEYVNISKFKENDTAIKTIHDLVKVKEENLDKYLIYDWYRRLSLIDHFLHKDTSYEDFRKCKYGEQGDFVLGKYAHEYSNNILKMSRKGLVWVDDKQIELHVEKALEFQKNGIKITYTLNNLSQQEIMVKFGSEFNFSFSEYKFENREISLLSEWKHQDVPQAINMEILFDRQTNLWIFPVETVSLSENGFERTHQGTALLPWWAIQFKPEETKTIEFSLLIG